VRILFSMRIYRICSGVSDSGFVGVTLLVVVAGGRKDVGGATLHFFICVYTDVLDLYTL
jgi:hypothetical protein